MGSALELGCTSKRKRFAIVRCTSATALSSVARPASSIVEAIRSVTVDRGAYEVQTPVIAQSPAARGPPPRNSAPMTSPGSGGASGVGDSGLEQPTVLVMRQHAIPARALVTADATRLTSEAVADQGLERARLERGIRQFGELAEAD